MKKIFTYLLFIAQTNSLMAQDQLSAKDECDQKKVALACARYAYSIKKSNPAEAMEYNQKACKLGNDVGCFNAEESGSKSAQGNYTIIARQEENVYGCYCKHTTDTPTGASVLNKKDKQKDLLFSFQITKLGELKSIKIDGGNINKPMELCLHQIFETQKFMTGVEDQAISINMNMPKCYQREPVLKQEIQPKKINFRN